jgi:DNA-binding HxlR family transcriptional regulator
MAQQQGCACCGSAEGADGGEPQGEEPACYCPIDGVIDTISKKHSLQIVGLLGANGPMRYSDLEETLEVNSSSMLSNRLDELAEEELIERRSYDEIPPRVEYSLTRRGRELETRIQPLLEWAAEEG